MVPSARKTVVAIDGPAAAGKSTVALCLANRLGFRFISSGLFYRAVSAVALRECGDPADENDVMEALVASNLVGDRDDIDTAGGRLDSEMLHSADVYRWLGTHTAMRSVRLYVNALLHAAAVEFPCVIEGRDIGTVVFPDAEAKVFLDATPEKRALRRQRQRGGDVHSVANAIITRDANDRAKEWGKLAQANDAILVDTSDLTADAVCDNLFRIVGPRLSCKS